MIGGGVVSPAGRGGEGAMHPHAGVQVVVVGLAGHVGHGEVYCGAVGDGHCGGQTKRHSQEVKRKKKKELSVRLSAVLPSSHPETHN